MYAQHDSLFKLISSLTSQEKKDFLKELRGRSGIDTDTSYSSLFREICGADVYNEELLKHRLRKYVNRRSFAVTKNKLREKILDFLRNKENTSVAIKLHKWLDYIEILYARGLYQEANLYCERVKETALKNELRYLVVEVNRWKGFVLQHLETANFISLMRDIRNESLKTVELMGLILHSGDYYSEVMSYQYNNQAPRNKLFREQIKKLKENPLFQLKAENDEYPFYMACYLATAKNLIYKFCGEFEKAYQQEKVVWERITSDWSFNYTNRHQEVVGAAINYLEALSTLKDKRKFYAHIKFIETLLRNEERGNKYLGAMVMLFKLNDIILVKGEKLATSDLVTFENYYCTGDLNDYEHIKREYEISLAKALLLKRNYEKAKNYLLRMQQTQQVSGAGKEQYERSQLLSILCEFSLLISTSLSRERLTMFQRILKTYYDHIRRKPKEDDYRLELLFIKFFQKLKTGVSQKDMAHVLPPLEKDLKMLLTEKSVYIQFVNLEFNYLLLPKVWKEYLFIPYNCLKL